jgi:predicted esterase
MSSLLDFHHEFVPGKSARTLLLLHGTGGTERDLLGLGRTLDPAAALLGVRGKVLENGMPRFFRRLAEGVFDEEDLIRRTHELADFVAAAAQQYRFDTTQVVAVGYSNGANIAGSLLLLHPGVLAGAALLRPMVPLVPNPLPDLKGTPILIAAGNHDPIVPPANTRELVALFEKAGAEVTLHAEETGHHLTEETIEQAQRWIAARGQPPK